MRLDQVIADIARTLEADGIDTARLDARLIAGHGLSLSETDLILHFDRQVSENEMRCLEALVARRLKREPVAHILGMREFWGLSIKVSPDVLVPRPDSETLVSGVLEAIKDVSAPHVIADIGTGSGCLLISLLSELPNARGIGIDIHEPTLDIARANALALGLMSRASFEIGNYAEPLTDPIDILISNPPYLAEAEMADLDADVAHYDPHRALVSGPSGLEAYEAIFERVATWHTKPGLMALEFGSTQSNDVLELASRHGLVGPSSGHPEILQDLAGRNRVLMLDFREI
ncbi:release factor glutamine methyltransferase [Cohaesibacter sp. ES.047]|uniref:peptide chain release factor N(5)-glutamine methyltransferase n=1 Tax=Cohaesibacter sp. ES.047 TaxID=1798205 RepID=UPI000BB9B9CE|nr:peptide chain release factor N(5)-glutamine methyltransferase [Cohaesibacter sp. ES.047]SNY92410.1 release factor glutamine methyltransferase [Cohaesibacter sp. ES.047]